MNKIYIYFFLFLSSVSFAEPWKILGDFSSTPPEKDRFRWSGGLINNPDDVTAIKQVDFFIYKNGTLEIVATLNDPQAVKELEKQAEDHEIRNKDNLIKASDPVFTANLRSTEKKKIATFLNLLDKIESLPNEFVSIIEENYKFNFRSLQLNPRSAPLQKLIGFFDAENQDSEKGKEKQTITPSPEEVTKRINEIEESLGNKRGLEFFIESADYLEQQDSVLYQDIILKLHKYVALANAGKISQESHAKLAFMLLSRPVVMKDLSDPNEGKNRVSKHYKKILEHAFAAGDCVDQDFIRLVAKLYETQGGAAPGERFPYPLEITPSTIVNLIGSIADSEARCKESKKRCREQEAQIVIMAKRIAELESKLCTSNPALESSVSEGKAKRQRLKDSTAEEDQKTGVYDQKTSLPDSAE